MFGIALEIATWNPIDGDGIAIARQCRKLGLMRFQLRQPNGESALPAQFQLDGLGKRARATIIASAAGKDVGRDFRPAALRIHVLVANAPRLSHLAGFPKLVLRQATRNSSHDLPRPR